MQKIQIEPGGGEPLVECIPNFSEGRRADVVDSIVAAIASVQGVQILDHSMDADHNRSVVTFAAPIQFAADAAFAGAAEAVKHIDLRKHDGVHPRIGAADVIPFVPLGSVRIDTCVELAHELGRRIADELNIPIYFYEYAAMREERRSLEAIRKHGYESLRSLMSQNQFTPDLGPSDAGPAGAVCIGARQPLIAYNVYLSTGNVAIAKQIARKVRTSSGGLPAVKALGLLVDGQAQVSMNLTDYTTTPIHVVQDAIAQAAHKAGTSIERSEIIGLVPEQALIDTALHYLKFPDVDTFQTLEQRLRSTHRDTPQENT